MSDSVQSVDVRSVLFIPTSSPYALRSSIDRNQYEGVLQSLSCDDVIDRCVNVHLRVTLQTPAADQSVERLLLADARLKREELDGLRENIATTDPEVMLDAELELLAADNNRPDASWRDGVPLQAALLDGVTRHVGHVALLVAGCKPNALFCYGQVEGGNFTIESLRHLMMTKPVLLANETGARCRPSSLLRAFRNFTHSSVVERALSPDYFELQSPREVVQSFEAWCSSETVVSRLQLVCALKTVAGLCQATTAATVTKALNQLLVRGEKYCRSLPSGAGDEGHNCDEG